MVFLFFGQVYSYFLNYSKWIIFIISFFKNMLLVNFDQLLKQSMFMIIAATTVFLVLVFVIILLILNVCNVLF